MTKFGPATRKGLFFGYHMHSGGIWSGDYIVLDHITLLRAMSDGGCTYRAVTRHRTEELVPPTAFTFPMKEMELADDCPPLGDESDDEMRTDLPPIAEGDLRPTAGGNLTPRVSNLRASDADYDSDDDTDDGEPSIVEEDSWEFNGSALIRHHRRPRREMFSPEKCDFAPPVPIHQIDVIRVTLTSLDTLDEKRIDDC